MIPRVLGRIVIAGALVSGVIAGGWYAVVRAKSKDPNTVPSADQPAAPAAVTVDIVHPKAGGIQRTCTQPGTVEPFEFADIYAKVSGFLVEQNVDIGSPVKEGQLLARISVPEYEKQVLRDEANVRNANAKIQQMTAHLAAAKAESKAAEASVVLTKVLVKAKTSYRQYREKQLKRYKELVKEKALEERIVDEQEDFYLSALEAENAAQENVNTSREKAVAAKAKVDQAAADLDQARAELGVAEADLQKSEVLLKYTRIESPFNGVITRRTFSPGKDGRFGAFIKAADQNAAVPLLTVERTDLMRVVIQVPDRDVPYVSTKSRAVVEIDALPGAVFETRGQQPLTVSRGADAEDPTTRTMRTEVDVPNPDGKLRHGMYGRVTLSLSDGTPGALRIPSSALVGKAEGGRGSVRIVREGKVHTVPVRFATDNGLEVEIVSGLTAEDRVITRATGTLEEGAPVTVHE